MQDTARSHPNLVTTANTHIINQLRYLSSVLIARVSEESRVVASHVLFMYNLSRPTVTYPTFYFSEV